MHVARANVFRLYRLVAATAALMVVAPAASAAEPLASITDSVAMPGLILDIATDPAGNTYVVGIPNESFTPTPGAALGSNPPGDFLVKVDSHFKLVYATYLPGAFFALALDSGGLVWAADSGGTLASIDPASGAARLIRVLPAGTRAESRALSVDASGYVYLAGIAYRGFPATPGAFQTEFKATEQANAFVLKFDPRQEKIVYATYLGGSVFEQPYSLAVDSVGNAYVGGKTYSPDFPVTPAAYRATPAPLTSGFIAKLNATGTALLYGSYVENVPVSSIAVAPDGSAILAHAHISRLSADGITFQTFEDTYGDHVAIDGSGNIITAGTLFGTKPPMINPLQADRGNPSPRTCVFRWNRPLTGQCLDAYLSKLDPQGRIVWSSVLGSLEDEGGGAVGVDRAGNIYAAVRNLPAFAALPGMKGGYEVRGWPTAYYSLLRVEHIGPPPLFSRNAIVSSADFVSPIVQGGLATIFGTGLTSSDGVTIASSFPLPATLAGTSISIAGKSGPLLSLSKRDGVEQMNFQVPLAVGYVTRVVVRRGRALGFAYDVPVPAAWPAIFTTADRRPIITHADYSLVTRTSPARRGDMIMIFATGLGNVTPEVPAGEAAPGSPLSVADVLPAVTVAGQDANVVFAGLVPGFAGLNQINLILPLTLPGPLVPSEYTLTISYKNQVTSSALIALQQ